MSSRPRSLLFNLFRTFDQERNGTVTREQFRNGLLRLFDGITVEQTGALVSAALGAEHPASSTDGAGVPYNEFLNAVYNRGHKRDLRLQAEAESTAAARAVRVGMHGGDMHYAALLDAASSARMRNVDDVLRQLHAKREEMGGRGLFERFDENGDGVISVPEFREGLAGFQLGVSERLLGQLVNMMDADGSGYIDIKEMKTAIDKAQVPPKPTLSRAPAGAPPPASFRTTFQHVDDLAPGDATRPEKPPAARSDGNRYELLQDDAARGVITGIQKGDRVHGLPTTSTAIRSTFRALDKDDDGFVDKRDLRRHLATSKESRLTEAELDWVVKMCDTNDDGYLQLNDMLRVMHRIGDETVGGVIDGRGTSGAHAVAAVTGGRSGYGLDGDGYSASDAVSFTSGGASFATPTEDALDVNGGDRPESDARGPGSVSITSVVTGTTRTSRGGRLTSLASARSARRRERRRKAGLNVDDTASEAPSAAPSIASMVSEGGVSVAISPLTMMPVPPRVERDMAPPRRLTVYDTPEKPVGPRPGPRAGVPRLDFGALERQVVARRTRFGATPPERPSPLRTRHDAAGYAPDTDRLVTTRSAMEPSDAAEAAKHRAISAREERARRRVDRIREAKRRVKEHVEAEDRRRTLLHASRVERGVARGIVQNEASRRQETVGPSRVKQTDKKHLVNTWVVDGFKSAARAPTERVRVADGEDALHEDSLVQGKAASQFRERNRFITGV